jgi:hypothetical protein
MVGSLQRNSTGISPGTNAMFSLRPTTLNIAPGTYTGSVNSTPREPGQGKQPHHSVDATDGDGHAHRHQQHDQRHGVAVTRQSADRVPRRRTTREHQLRPGEQLKHRPACRTPAARRPPPAVRASLHADRLQPVRRVPDQPAGDRGQPMRRQAIASEGAEVVVVDGTYEEAVAAAETAAQAYPRPSPRLRLGLR